MLMGCGGTSHARARRAGGRNWRLRKSKQHPSNPKNDARNPGGTATGLRSCKRSTPTSGGFPLALQQFAAATGADVALFFYAGHAMQHHGRNYLMPID